VNLQHLHLFLFSAASPPLPLLSSAPPYPFLMVFCLIPFFISTGHSCGTLFPKPSTKGLQRISPVEINFTKNLLNNSSKNLTSSSRELSLSTSLGAGICHRYFKNWNSTSFSPSSCKISAKFRGEWLSPPHHQGFEKDQTLLAWE